MYHVAKALAQQGRGPDTELVHMTKGEVTALAGMAGLRSLPTNPKTGLPEAGLLSMMLPIAASMFLGPEAGWLMNAGAGALGGMAGSALEGGNVLRGGLMGGLSGGMAGYAQGANMMGTAPSAELAPLAADTSSASLASSIPGAPDYVAPTGDIAPPEWGRIPLGEGQTMTPTDLARNWTVPPPANSDYVAPTGGTAEAATPSAPYNKWTDFNGWTNPATNRPDYGTAYEAAKSAHPGASDPVLVRIADANMKANTPGMLGQAWDLAAANPKTSLALGAAGIYGLDKAMKPFTPAKKPVYMAGASHSNIAQSGAPPVYGGAEQNYFTGNSADNYYSDPGYTKYYADGGQVQTSNLFNAPLMPEHQRPGAISNDQQFAGGGQIVDVNQSGWYDAAAAGSDGGTRRYIQSGLSSDNQATTGGIKSLPPVHLATGGLLNLRAHGRHMDPLFTRGAGDGMSDSIRAQIDGRGQRADEPIRVADGEFIVPADVVAHIGNGSSNAGAKKMDALMAKIRKAKTGKTKQPAEMNMSRFMPA